MMLMLQVVMDVQVLVRLKQAGLVQQFLVNKVAALIHVEMES
jgi:hypothetical protein